MASRIILLNTEQNKSRYLCDEMFFRHYWLQIKLDVGSDLIPQDTAGYHRLRQETAGYLYIKTYHFILIHFIARKYFMDIYLEQYK